MVVQTVPLMIHRQQPMCVSRTELNVDRLLLFRDGMLIVVVLSIAGVSGLLRRVVAFSFAAGRAPPARIRTSGQPCWSMQKEGQQSSQEQ